MEAHKLHLSTYAKITYSDDLTHRKYAIIIESTRTLILPFHVYKLWNMAENEKEREKVLKSLKAKILEFEEDLCIYLNPGFYPLVEDLLILDSISPK